jgi:hypothetical protein
MGILSRWTFVVAAMVFAAAAPTAKAQGGDYAAVLRALDPARPESIVGARDAALSTYAKADSTTADAVFRQFQAFYDRAIAAVPPVPLYSPLAVLLSEICKAEELTCRASTADAFLASSTPDDVKRRGEHREALAALTRYRANGIWFSFGEGDWYATRDSAFLTGVAAGLPLGELREWVVFRAVEDRQRIAEDAGLLIGWDDLRQRIGRWETFARAHPALPETREMVRPEVIRLVAFYVLGVDNTRAYDERFGAPAAGLRIDPRLMASYERFLAENRDSAYYSVIEGIVMRLRASGGAPTPALIDFLRAQLTDSFFQQWLRGAERWFGGARAGR